jgi:hypothetical protein
VRNTGIRVSPAALKALDAATMPGAMMQGAMMQRMWRLPRARH